jgi:GxxExxY protein
VAVRKRKFHAGDSRPATCANYFERHGFMTNDQLTGSIISAAIEVHKQLGPGLLESIYETCLAHELELKNIVFEKQKSLPIHYKGKKLEDEYRVDFLVNQAVIVELKAVDEINNIAIAQTMTYMKLLNCKVGLIINFNTVLLKNGIKRISL